MTTKTPRGHTLRPFTLTADQVTAYAASLQPAIVPGHWRPLGGVLLADEATPRVIFGARTLAHAVAVGRSPVPARVALSADNASLLHALDTGSLCGLPFEAEAAAALADAHITLADIACLLGLASRADAQRRVSLGRRPAPLRHRLDGIHAGHLRYLSTLSDAAFGKWIEVIRHDHLTVDGLRRRLTDSGPLPQPTSSSDLDSYARRLSASLGAPVRIRWPDTVDRRGIEIAWFTPDDLIGITTRVAQAEPVEASHAPRRRWLNIEAQTADELDALFGHLTADR